MTTLSGLRLQEIGAEIFGENWRKPLAESIGLSYARVSQLSNSTSVPAKPAAKVLALHQQWKQDGSVTPGIVQIAQVPKDEDEGLTDQQIVDRVNKRFMWMERVVDAMVAGRPPRAMIVSGAPGIGKTYNLEQKLKKAHKEQHLEYSILRGTCSAPGLYQSLYNAKDGGIVVIDDCDSIFGDEQAFNILKAALDTSNVRTIAWRKQSSWVYDANGPNADAIEAVGERFPNEFDFNGAVIFITNLDFPKLVDKGSKMSPHFGALMSRVMYFSLTLNTMRSRVLRIKDVFHSSMRQTLGLSRDAGDEILAYVLDNADRISELSLRTIKHIADVYHLGQDWRELVEITKMKYPKLD